MIKYRTILQQKHPFSLTHLKVKKGDNQPFAPGLWILIRIQFPSRIRIGIRNTVQFQEGNLKKEIEKMHGHC